MTAAKKNIGPLPVYTLYHMKNLRCSTMTMITERKESCEYNTKIMHITRTFVKGDFLDCFTFYVLYSTLLHLPPSDSTVSKDAGIEPRTVASTA